MLGVDQEGETGEGEGGVLCGGFMLCVDQEKEGRGDRWGSGGEERLGRGFMLGVERQVKEGGGADFYACFISFVILEIF